MVNKFRVGDTVRVKADHFMTFGYTGEIADPEKHVQFKGRVGIISGLFTGSRGDFATVQFPEGWNISLDFWQLEKLDV